VQAPYNCQNHSLGSFEFVLHFVLLFVLLALGLVQNAPWAAVKVALEYLLNEAVVLMVEHLIV
jgi:hypothetical protein